MTNQSRQPKGQNTGGQFAASQNPESTLDLDIDIDDLLSEEDIETMGNDDEIQFWKTKADEYRAEAKKLNAAAQEGERFRQEFDAAIRNEERELELESKYTSQAIVDAFHGLKTRLDLPTYFAFPLKDQGSERDLAKLSESIEMLRGYYITSDDELSEEMHHELNKTFDVLDALPKGAVAYPRTNPAYAKMANFINAGDIRTRLNDVPDDEPVISWIRTKESAEKMRGLSITPEQWAAICTKADEDQDLFDVAYDTFTEVLDAVLPEEKP